MKRFVWPATRVVGESDVQTLTFAEKSVSEVLPYSMTFSDLLQPGEAINGVSTTASVYSGTDATPQNIVDGAPTYTGTNVTQNITGGVSGVIYVVMVLVTATNAHNYAKIFYVSVVPDTGGI